MTRTGALLAALAAALIAVPAAAQVPARVDSAKADTTRADSAKGGLDGAIAAVLHPRLVGPAMISGRISSLAVDPRNPGLMYVGAASGGVWKTENGGATWSAIFERQGSFSIGTVMLDPKSPSTIWVGSGENNSQRSVAYGDGVYRSDDAGRTWKKMGLEKSEHIARIVIDPRNSDVVYVAAQGPLWADGGDRGLYKTTDGGKSWNAVLAPSEDPHQRRPRKRAPALDRRRQDVAQDQQRNSLDDPWPDRPRGLTGKSRHHLRDDRGGERRRRHLPVRRQWRDVGKAQQLHRAADVLRHARGRSIQHTTPLLHGCRHASLR